MAEITNYEEASALLEITKECKPSEILMAVQKIYEKRNDDDIHWTVSDLKKARNILLQDSVSRQIKEQRYFEIVSPFKNTCIICKGAGEIYKFVKKSVGVNCHICAGKGEIKTPIKVQCEKCKGTGRFKKRWKEGGGIDVSCKFCKDGFNIEVKTTKCNNCLGKGKIEKLVLSDEIESTTPCNRCQQKGFIEPKPPTKKFTSVPLNPVISTSLATKIKELFVESEPPPAE